MPSIRSVAVKLDPVTTRVGTEMALADAVALTLELLDMTVSKRF